MKRNKALLLFTVLFLSCVMMLCMLPVSASANESSASVGTVNDFLNALNNDSITNINITAPIDLTAALPVGSYPLGVFDVSGRTIDLGGNKITASNFTLIFEGSSFTLKNGSFDSNGGSYALFIGDEAGADNVLLEELTLTGGLNVYNSSNVVLRNVNITADAYYAIWCDENTEVTVESGTFAASDESTAVLGMVQSEDYPAELTVNGGDFAANEKKMVLDNGDTNTPVINSGSFDQDILEFVAADKVSASLTSSESAKYYVGTSEEIKNVLIETAEQGDSITIQQGNVALSALPGGITVKNEGSGTVTVDGDEVDDNSQVVTCQHDLTETKSVAATCTTPGKKGYYTCDVCSKHFEDENAKLLIENIDAYGVIEASHHWKTEWNKGDANGHWHDCEMCTSHDVQVAHNFTDSSPKTCTICGYIIAEPSPDTGDNSQLMLWAVLLFVSASVLTGAVLYGRKSKAVK